MTPAELRTRLERIRWTQAQLARALGITPRIISFWLAGKHRVPGYVQAYLATVPVPPPPFAQRRLGLPEPEPDRRHRIAATDHDLTEAIATMQQVQELHLSDGETWQWAERLRLEIAHLLETTAAPEPPL